jgi:hypothetical protein
MRRACNNQATKRRAIKHQFPLKVNPKDLKRADFTLFKLF